MAHIEDRWFDKKTGEKTSRHGSGKRWILRWRGPDGKERKQSYARKSDADDQRKEIEGRIRSGTYIDPKAGTQTFDEYAAYWVAHRTNNRKTKENIDDRLRRYVTGTPMGRTPLAKIRPTAVQAWLKSLTVKENTASVVYAHVHSILASAVDDEIITRNPCDSRSVNRPRKSRKPIEVLWTAKDVQALYDALPERYQPLVILGARLGLRPSESFGLAVDDIGWLSGGSVTVRRQVKLLKNHGRVFDLPKEGKARVVPLSPGARDLLAEYLTRFPPQTVTLPDVDPEGPPEQTVRLLLTNEYGRALHSASVDKVWRPARVKAGIADERQNGLHMLRHFYATTVLAATGNAASVASYIGHASPGFTVDTYTHPRSIDWNTTKTALDAVFTESSDHAAGAH